MPRALRVVWVPGSDRLRGVCHCGAEHVADGPVEVWDWLLAHPAGHGGGVSAEPTGGPLLTGAR